MARKPYPLIDATGRGPYDPDPLGEEDLWFMPAAPDEGMSPVDLPWPVAARPTVSRTSDWGEAEAANAQLLARAAMALGALDERVRQGPPGWRRRLICMEVADLSWHLGDRVAVDRLALFLVLRLSGAGEDGQAMARAAWAVRRLERDTAMDLADLSGFLGREPVNDASTDPDLMTRPMGAEFEALAQEWRGSLAQAEALHPLTRAALAWIGWRRMGMSGEDAQLEGAIVASRMAAQALRRAGLGFVPLALGGADALRAVAPAGTCLQAWYQGVENAALRGLMECDRMEVWQTRAGEAIKDLSGRTPRHLVQALTQWPLASAPMLEHETGSSRAAVQRNMTRFEGLGLVREVTGQSRFRFWQAAVQ
ncbi:hypothetical protein [Pseudoruegeria sp. SK021]|uniref:hypothetical protein n=1 Tax=Pseudoruegeria sp. SK021 TaxID=1933035 RepID=UPI000A23EA12|nr:hypothetical protein [Pseudoruegeria sp. SK021]OSP56001.1 hypothetical protein BV911_04985 [Pseudoruegeria sp. SK021]